MDFPGGTVDANLPANAEDAGLIAGPGRVHFLRGSSSCVSQTTEPECALQREASHHSQRKPLHSNKDPVQPKLNK